MAKALLVDPEKGSVSEIEFDGNEESAAELIGCEHLDWETYPGFRVLMNAEAIDKSSEYGFVLEHTGGAVHHGRCLIIGRGHPGNIRNVGVVEFKFRYIPGYGVTEWK